MTSSHHYQLPVFSKFILELSCILNTVLDSLSQSRQVLLQTQHLKLILYSFVFRATDHDAQKNGRLDSNDVPDAAT
jgi:hypothetical protein